MGRFNESAASGQPPRISEETLREFCGEMNQRAMRAKWSNWLHVSKDKDTGACVVKSRTGADAKDILKLLDGWYPDFIGWDNERLDTEFRILRHMARMGMPEADWLEQGRRVMKPARRLEPA